MTPIQFTENFTKECCVACGIYFWMPSVHHQNVKDNSKDFHCPNGHSMSYRKSAAQIANEKLLQKENEISKKNAEIVKLQREVARLSKPKRKRK